MRHECCTPAVTNIAPAQHSESANTSILHLVVRTYLIHLAVPGSSSGSNQSTHPVNQEDLEGCAGAFKSLPYLFEGTGCFPASAPQSQTIHSVSYQVIKAGISHLSKFLSFILSPKKFRRFYYLLLFRHSGRLTVRLAVRLKCPLGLACGA